MSKPLILLLMSKSDIRYKITKALEGKAQVTAGMAIDDTLAEIKWNSIEGVVIDMTDDEIDGYANLDVIRSTYPSIPVFLLVDEDGKNDQLKNEDNTTLLSSHASPEDMASAILGKKPAASSSKKNVTANEKFITEMTRYRNNLRRVEDYVGMEIEQALRDEVVTKKNLEFLNRVNVGLEGFLQLQIEGRDE